MSAGQYENNRCEPLSRLSHLLCERPVRYDTPHLHEAQSHLREQDDSIALQVGRPESFRGYRELQLAPLGSIGLSMGCIEAGNGYELSFKSRDEMLVNIPLRGAGWVTGGGQTLAMRTGQLLLVGPSCRVSKHWQGPGQVLSLHIPLSTIEAALGQRSEHPLPLYLPPVTLLDHSRMHTLLGFVELLLTDSVVDGRPTGSAVLKQAEHLLLALLVEGLEQVAPEIRAKPETHTARPYYVRRAEDYMRAHASAELTLDDLALAAGVSSRTLQYGFRKAHGSTPMLHLKRIRLEQARGALRTADKTQRKVCDVAAATGFGNVSQFSRDYRAMFGESPSETAAAPRRLCV